ncbi:hypothetical protein KV557_31105 [Kitasatospora aureofaciens]|uniref:hypothetical protein n=1 Tax=Kitasatospora aureofaciens TaxID=1894 RepID=UPI001C4478D1|nr:hypothetical protein [Kitasatospora aureofaciens]MBV6701510.1 hypothetical protein [Kitasatospora aureofaciens]
MKNSTIRLRVSAQSVLLAVGVAALLGLGPTSAFGAGVHSSGDDRWGISTPTQPGVQGNHWGINKELFIKADDRWGRALKDHDELKDRAEPKDRSESDDRWA